MNFENIVSSFITEAKQSWMASETYVNMQRKKQDFFRSSLLVNNVYVLSLA